MRETEVNKWGISGESLFRKPKDENEVPYLFHLTLIVKILILLAKRGISVTAKKIIVSLWKSIEFLGFKIGEDRALGLSEKMRKHIMEVQAPKDKKGVESIVGLFNFN